MARIGLLLFWLDILSVSIGNSGLTFRFSGVVSLECCLSLHIDEDGRFQDESLEGGDCLYARLCVFLREHLYLLGVDRLFIFCLV